MKIKKNKFILGLSLSFCGAVFLIAPMNYLLSNTENNILSNLLQNSQQSIKNLNDDIRLSFDNRNDDLESPNGVARIIGDSVIAFTSWFNSEVWRYDVKGNNTIAKKFFKNINSISNLKVKYNQYNNTYLIYGTINSSETSGGTSSNSQFVIQVNADDGSEFIVNNNYLYSIWTSSVIRGINDLVVNENDGNIIVIPVYQEFSNPQTTSISKFSSTTYSYVWYKFSSLNGNFNYRATNSIPIVFSLDENFWGFINFHKETGNNNDKYEYLLFDYDLNFVAKSSEITLSSSDNLHSDKILPTPLVFPFENGGIKKYKIVDTSIAPIYTLDTFNENSEVDNAFQLRIFTFTPKNGSTNAVITKETDMTTNYISYQLKKDDKNNAFYVSGFEKKANNGNQNKIDFLKNKITIYKFNATTGQISASSVIDNIYTDKKAITNISIINDPKNKETKTALVKESKIYPSSTNKFTTATQINDISQLKYLIDVNSSTKNTPTSSSWDKLVKEDYKTNVTDELKSKLPSDVNEDSIKSLIKYKNNNDIVQVTNSLKVLNVQNNFELSGTKRILYNNATGNLKATVQSSLKKWWYKLDDNSENSRFLDETEIQIEGFSKISDLSFRLVISAEVDSTKWNKIQNDYLGKVLPSSLTEQNIIDTFFIKGEKINISTSDIEKVNVDEINLNSSSSMKSTQVKKPISVLCSDQNGTLEIKYDLSSKSSPSMPSNNVIGSYVYDGFLSSNSIEQVTINQEKFTELKRKRLSHQFSVEDILGVIEAPNIYDTSDTKKWELKYKNNYGTDAFKSDLINGKTNFTFKYLKPIDFPAIIDESKYTIEVSSEQTKQDMNLKIDGSGTQKILDYIWDDRTPSLISFDQNQANIITGSKTLEEIKKDIDSILSETIFINNRWFDTNQLVATINNNEIKDKQIKFDLSFKENKIISNIDIFDSEGQKIKLVFDQSLRDEIAKSKPNIFDMSQITFNYDLLNFNWKYGLSSENGNFIEISFNELINKVNEDRKNQGLELLKFSASLSPSKFLNELGNKNFNDYFPMINLSNQSEKSEPWYYEMSKIEIIPNDENGTISIRYELVYPNLSTSTEVYKNPEVKIVGFKSETFSNSIVIILISVFCFIAIFLIIFIPIIVNAIRNKKLNNSKKVLSLKYKNRVVKK